MNQKGPNLPAQTRSAPLASDRQARLAEALRENLRKRKLQKRKRSDAAGDGGEAASKDVAG